MKIKEFTEKYSKKVTKKPIKEKKFADFHWIFIITILAFTISFGFSFLSEMIIPNVTIGIAIFVTFLFIFLGILFDMIGVAITVGDMKTFNSMAAKQVRGSKIAVRLIKNASKASSFCNDVIGDICGIISGSTGVAISTIISTTFNLPLLWVMLTVTAIIASLTIGGKALGKSFAMNKSSVILYEFSKLLSFFYRK